MELRGIASTGSFVGHTRRVSAVALSPDGRRALAGTYDRRVQLFELDWS